MDQAANHENSYETINQLLHYGTDINAISKQKENALAIAKRLGNHKAIYSLHRHALRDSAFSSLVDDMQTTSTQ